jgi:hypothetical protein
VSPETIGIITLIVSALTLIAAIIIPIILTQRLQTKVKEETSQLISRLDQQMGAAVKLLEVRDYYSQTAAQYKKMLDEAYKEGNRFRQDEIRKLQERLEALKARALDKQVRILSNESPARKRRRRKPRNRNPQNQQRSGKPNDDRKQQQGGRPQSGRSQGQGRSQNNRNDRGRRNPPKKESES